MDVDSPSDNQTPNACASAFSRWKTIYDNLVSTFDSFLAESTKFDPALLQPDAHKWSGFEDSLLQVDTALTLISTRARDARAVLGKMRNQSKTLVPMRKLPAEIIVHILSFVKVDCITNYRYFRNEGMPFQPLLLASASVASKWLWEVATSAPSLWTHIDLAIGKPYEQGCLRRAQSYLRLSGQKPLHVHVINTKQVEGVVEIVKLLAPHTHRIASLDLQTSGYHARGILLGLFSNIASCRIQELRINDLEEAEEPTPDDYHELFESRLSEFFRSLRVITINGPELPMNDVAFSGLTALNLSVHSSVALNQPLSKLRGVLAACPALRALSLHFYSFNAGLEMPKEPVLLPELELLDLRQTDSTDDLLGILSIITPGSAGLTFSVSYECIGEIEATKLQRFIQQWKVKRLLLETHPNQETPADDLFPRFTEGFPTVQELALVNYDLEDLVYKSSFGAFPSLCTLHLLRCRSDLPAYYDQLVSLPAIQMVYADEFSRQHIAWVGDPLAQQRSYPKAGEGEGCLEWPIRR
ncbi:hypothetical protein FRC09_013648 [Ceratobasidium sp. 395]|nr:hypothetical protein FRC09_013648 [Ceratobasidium sp. 395]